MKIKIYAVSLEGAIERRKNIKQQLDKFDFEYEIIDAIDGRLLSDDDLSEKCDLEVVNKHPKWLTKGAIGCALSHYIVYNKIIEDKVDYGIVLEDDAELVSNFEQVVNELINKSLLDENTATLLFTQNNSGNPEFSTIDEKKIIGKFTLNFPLDMNSMVTAIGYIISNKVAHNLNSSVLPICVAADSWNHFLEQGIFDKINCILPYIATPYGFESTIGYSLRQSGLKVKIKSFLRTFLPKLFRTIVRKNTKKYLKNVSQYKKVNKNHLFVE